MTSVRCKGALFFSLARSSESRLCRLGRGSEDGHGPGPVEHGPFRFLLFSSPGRVGSAQLGRGEVKMGLFARGQPMSAVPFSFFLFFFFFHFSFLV